MDGDSPVALDPSWQYEFSTQNSGEGITTSDGIEGFSISHDRLGRNSGFDDRARDSSIIGSHHHSASMVSIDSGVDHDTNGTTNPLKPQQRAHDQGGNDGASADDRDQEGMPAWSELKTKAGKERKRLPLACIACRRKKIKCSGEKPACKHCLKARIPCVYKVTTRKAAPRTDYMAMLDKRLKRMEDRVIKIIPKEDLPDTSQRSSVRPPLPGASAKTDEKADSGSKRTVEEAFTHEMSEWAKPRIGSTQLDNAARIRSQRDSDNKLFTEGADALPPQPLQEHLAEVFFDCVYGQAYLLLHKPSFMRKLKAGNVPPVLTLAMCAISARFSTHPQISTEPAFLRGEQWATPAKSIVEKRHFEPNITILTVMIILGLHYFGTCEGGLSWSFGGQAMRMGYALQLHKELDHDSFGVAQAERAAASGKPMSQPPELSFTDREIRRRTMWACYLMDTFNSSGTERPSFLNEDYFFIQLPIKESHFQMEIPGATEDLDGHVPLRPSRTSLTEAQPSAKANMGVAAYLMKAVVIWKRVVKYLNLGGKEKDSHPIWDPLSQFANLQRQITQLKSSLPSTLTYSQENLQTHVTERLANQFIFMHIVIAQNSLFLHRFAIPTAPNTHRPYPPNTPKPFLATAATTVLDAASQISKLLSDSQGHTLTAPFAGYCAYSSATVHVWGMFSKNVMLENTSRDNLRHNYKYLNRMKRYWGMFHYMAESIKDTYRCFADAAARASKKQRQPKAARSPSQTADPVQIGAITAEQQSRAASPSPVNELDDDNTKMKADGTKINVFQYGDWFNKYPHGVSEQEWEQSHLPHRRETQKGAEAVMSQQAELQSVEEFFANLSPPSKVDDGPNKKKMARKRGKSNAEPSLKAKETPASQGRKDSTTSKAGPDKPQQRHGVTSNSLYPLSDRQFPQLDLPNADIDIPMSGVSAGLQSSHGSSAFDLASPNSAYPYPAAPTSNPQYATQQQHPVQQSHSPFDYTSPASSSNTGSNQPTNSALNFPFNYTSAVPQLDRQMVFGGQYSNSAQDTSGQGFWADPWSNSSVDVDGYSGFNDPSFGLMVGPGNMRNNQEDEEERQRRISALTEADRARIHEAGNPIGSGAAAAVAANNNSQNQNMSSTAWFMPFNIDPPQQSQPQMPGPAGSGTGTGFTAANTPAQGFDDFGVGFDNLMDLGGYTFSPLGEQQAGVVDQDELESSMRGL